jgi:polyisoprenoid-binding protein YceI
MRKTTLVLRLASVLIFALAAAPASATEWRVDLDPERTTVTFRLKATMHTVHGTAKLASGSLIIDPDAGTVGGEIVIDAPSAETGNGSRDKKMHGKVLLSGDHPRIVLRPHRIEGNLTAGPNITVAVVGDLELLGASHPITIPLNIRIDGSSFAATAEFTVPYVAWGLKDPSTFVLRVAKEVTVRLTTEGTIDIGDGDR